MTLYAFGCYMLSVIAWNLQTYYLMFLSEPANSELSSPQYIESHFKFMFFSINRKIRSLYSTVSKQS